MDTLQSMRVWVRVVETGSFTAAARALDLSTAQVSRLVSELEQHLQARLLHRTTRRLALTEAGERYLQRCRQILTQIDEATAEARGAHLTPSGRLRLHSLTGLGLHITPLIARYCELYPQVVIELTLSQRNPDPLEEGQDVVLTVARELPDSQLVAQPLGQFYSVVCAAPDYLSQHGVPRRPADLGEHRCLRLLDPTYPDAWTFRDAEGEHVLQLGQTFQVNVAESLAKAAQAGMGVSLLPFFVATQPLREGKLLRVLPRYRLQERGIYALYPSRLFLDAKIKTWVEFLRVELPKLFAEDKRILENPDHWAEPERLLRFE